MNWSTKRRTPYTEAGVRRLACIRCSGPAVHQWNACADGFYRPLCLLCDVALNRLVLDWMGHPRARQVADAYSLRAQEAA